MLTPLVQGDKKEGFIAFYEKDIKESELAQKGTTLRLTCHDVFGNTITSETETYTGNGGYVHFPGLESF